MKLLKVNLNYFSTGTSSPFNYYELNDRKEIVTKTFVKEILFVSCQWNEKEFVNNFSLNFENEFTSIQQFNFMYFV